MSSPIQVAILGAGYVGTATARALAGAGAQVWAVRRSAQPAEAGIHWLRGDVAGGNLSGLPARLDAVLLTVAPGATSGYDGTYPPSARCALSLFRASGARALIYTSSTGVYGGESGAWVAEDSPRRGAGGGGAALIEAEDVLLDAALPGITVLRVAGIYGPGRDSRARYADPSRLPMRGEYWVNMIHRDDIVAVIQFLLPGTAAPRALNLADGTPTLAADIARWVAARRGIDPGTLRFGNDAERSRSNQRVSTTVLAATGWRPRYPSFREGFTDGL
jgi:nucleoside-diphosphate-sugar epimerase